MQGRGSIQQNMLQNLPHEILPQTVEFEVAKTLSLAFCSSEIVRRKKLGRVQVGNVPFSPEIFITDVAVSDAASILSLSLTVVDLDTVARSRCNRDRRRVRVF